MQPLWELRLHKQFASLKLHIANIATYIIASYNYQQMITIFPYFMVTEFTFWQSHFVVTWKNNQEETEELENQVRAQEILLH